MTAFVEEFVYRGVLYVWLLQKQGEVKSFLIVQLFFLLAHVPVVLLSSPTELEVLARFVFTILLGAVYSLVFRLNKSLYSAVVAHGVWNTLAFLLVLA